MEKLKILWNNRMFYAIMRRNNAKKNQTLWVTQKQI